MRVDMYVTISDETDFYQDCGPAAAVDTSGKLNLVATALTQRNSFFRGGCQMKPLSCEIAKQYYRKISNIRRTKSPNLNVSRLVLPLYLPNPVKLGVKLRMKM